MKNFIKQILKDDFLNNYQNIFDHSLLLRYLDSKMGAIYGDSKTRRNLANICAIYSMTYFYESDFYNDPNKYKNFVCSSLKPIFFKALFKDSPIIGFLEFFTE
ncbi:hypothetical protein [Helicobacter sp. 11S03491-1]|uniref:hypothetical protein n=1 Tax=Helicobacter sp. 11S03491-1 TaxID=1476196 RepID=UPI000BA7D24A|nr:hypothetical protein [Helicobacter sp. 11S03491-1]PAF41689.1 hypothetical protein BKH45_06255 [Helicobacter sp. 11S03491-1]